MTGTPVQNSPAELLSLMGFVDREAFGGEEERGELMRRYGQISEPEQVILHGRGGEKRQGVWERHG
jgi:SNF2 family DNA or RNA helicase